MANINIDQLAAEIAKGLAEYSQDVAEKVNASSERVGKAQSSGLSKHHQNDTATTPSPGP